MRRYAAAMGPSLNVKLCKTKLWRYFEMLMLVLLRKLLTIFNLETLYTMLHLQGLEMFTEGPTVHEEAEATLMMTLLLD